MDASAIERVSASSANGRRDCWKVDAMVQVRSGLGSDAGFLEAMLFEAFFWSPSTDRPPFVEFRKHPEFVKLSSGWGRAGDRLLIAEDGDARLGAAWFRLWTDELHSYGFVDSKTPEVAMAVSPRHRGRGIGRLLLSRLLATAREDQFTALSLSVDPSNHARRLYESFGFQQVGEAGTSWTYRVALH